MTADDKPCRYAPRCSIHPAVGLVVVGAERLSRSEVFEIMDMRADSCTTIEIAERFNITRSSVKRVIAGQAHKATVDQWWAEELGSATQSH